MVFVHINPSNPDTSLLNSLIDNGNQVFVLFYLDGCGPCEATKPQWKNLENEFSNFSPDDRIVIADVDQTFLPNINGNLQGINSFPTIMHMSNKGKTLENYERERTTESFKDWINSKLSSMESSPRTRSTSSSKASKTKTRSLKNKKNHRKTNKTNKRKTSTLGGYRRRKNKKNHKKSAKK